MPIKILTPYQEQYIRDNSTQLSVNDLGKAIGLSRGVVRRWMNSNNTPRLPRGRRNNGLTETEKAFIRLKAGKLSSTAIARHLKRNGETIRAFMKAEGLETGKTGRPPKPVRVERPKRLPRVEKPKPEFVFVDSEGYFMPDAVRGEYTWLV